MLTQKAPIKYLFTTVLLLAGCLLLCFGISQRHQTDAMHGLAMATPHLAASLSIGGNAANWQQEGSVALLRPAPVSQGHDSDKIELADEDEEEEREKADAAELHTASRTVVTVINYFIASYCQALAVVHLPKQCGSITPPFYLFADIFFCKYLLHRVIRI